MAKEKKKKSKIVLFIIIIIIFSGSYFGLKYYFNYSKIKISKLDRISLKPEVIIFTNKMLPEVYNKLTIFDKEIKIIDTEIKRLAEIGKSFPDEKKIVDSETKKWSALKKNIQKALNSIEKSINSIYVSFSVNKKTGTDLITEGKKELNQKLKNTLLESDKETTRLKNREKKSFTEKIKDFLF